MIQGAKNTVNSLNVFRCEDDTIPASMSTPTSESTSTSIPVEMGIEVDVGVNEPLPVVEEDPSRMEFASGVQGPFDTTPPPEDFTGLDLFLLVAGIIFVVIIIVCIYLLLNYEDYSRC